MMPQLAPSALTCALRGGGQALDGAVLPTQCERVWTEAEVGDSMLNSPRFDNTLPRPQHTDAPTSF
jgi:hypothetical protein